MRHKNCGYYIFHRYENDMYSPFPCNVYVCSVCGHVVKKDEYGNVYDAYATVTFNNKEVK